MKKTTSIILLILLFLHISSLSAINIIPLNQTAITSTDIPTWYIGDYWTYTVSPLSYTSPNGSFTGTITNLNQLITDITTIEHHGALITAYELSISGTITGMLTYEGISGDLQGTLSGISYIRQADLAELTTSITSTGTVTIYIIQQPYSLIFNTDFNPPFELYDFPLHIGEHWNTTTYSTNTGSFQISSLINDTFSSATWINETITCNELDTITVPAGTFTAYSIHHGSTNVWYGPDIGNIINTHISQTTNNTTLDMTLSLTDYSLTTPSITLSSDINPNPAILHQPVTITGVALDTATGQPIETANITLTIPATTEQYYTTTNATGNYSITFTTPHILDNTVTQYDIGSDGIHLLCTTPTTSSYTLATLVVRTNSPPSTPSITGKTQGQPNTEYTYNFQSTDPEHDILYLMVDWGDTTQIGWIGPYASEEIIPLNHSWNEKDAFKIRAKTKDIYNAESDWATLEIQIPYTHIQHYHKNALLIRIVTWLQTQVLPNPTHF